MKKTFKINHCDGELMSHWARVLRRRNKPDTPFFHDIVPWIVLVLCASIDFTLFLSTFSRLSYSNGWMRAFGTAGLLVGFDLVPIFLAIHAKRLHMKLTDEKLFLYIMGTVVALAITVNIFFNVATMHALKPNETEQQSGFTQQVSGVAEAPAAQTAQEEQEVIDRRGALALVVFSCVTPLITSMASYSVSYFTYNPLDTRKRHLEAAIWAETGEINDAQAYLDEFESKLKGFYPRAVESDEVAYRAILDEERALVLYYCATVRSILTGYLTSPRDRSALAVNQTEELLKQLDSSLDVLEQRYNTSVAPLGDAPPQAPSDNPVPTTI